MKKLFLIFSLMLSINSFAQDDLWFPNNGGVWEMKTYYGYPDGFWNNYSVYLSDSAFWNYNDTMWYDCSYGLIHIDSGRVYYKALWGPPGGLTVYVSPYGPSDTTTQKLYDFTLSIGDTAYVRDNFHYEVIDIDTTLFLGIPRKTLHLGSGWNEWDTWVEGVGSVNGFFYPWAHLFEASCSMCFFTGHYVDSLGVEYTLTYDNPSTCETLEIEENKVHASIRCSGDRIEITSEKTETLKIFSADGRFVYGQKVPVGESYLNIDFLERGAYIINIGSSFSEKFIKT